MDEKRTRILIRDLRTTGRLFNLFGEQYWHSDIKKEKGIREEVRW